MTDGTIDRPFAREDEDGASRSFEAYQNRSEVLVCLVQLAVVALFGALYLASQGAGGAAPDTKLPAISRVVFDAAPYAVGLYGLFTLGRLVCAWIGWLPSWLIVLSIIADMATLFGMIWSFHIQYAQPPAFYLKAPTLLYVFVFIALRALRLETRHVLIAGGAAIAGWSALVVYAAVNHPSIDPLITRDYIVYMHSAKLLIGAEIDKLVTIAVVTGILALGVRRGRELLMRERRAAADVERQSRRLYEVAYFDADTGLPNATNLAERLAEPRTDARASPIIVLTLPDLRRMTASFGQGFTRALVAQVHDRLATAMAPNDLLGRLDADSFVVVPREQAAFDRATLDRVTWRAERLLRLFDESISLDGRSIFLRPRAGIAFHAPGDDPAQSLRDAEIAAIHDEVRADVVVFELAMRDRVQALAALEADLRLAIESPDQLAVVYQPIMHADGGGLAGFEALVRWVGPEERGVVSPANFIPVAEATGLIVTLGRKVLTTACRQLVAFQAEISTDRPLFMSVNVSPRQLTDLKVIDRFRTALARARVDPSLVKLEITESASAGSPEETLTVLRRLCDLGVSLSLDDFGTGYSSLSHLHRYPFSTIKVDQSFVRRVLEDESAVAMVRSVSDIARSLGMDTVAEGVEDEATAAVMRDLGVTCLQGYHFAKPMSAEDVIAWSRERDSASV